ncbi:FmdE family protein [Nitratiruptor tergarcus]|uniref:Formylmethanofuran dehydrogenase subunit E n=1 Tax=Nitratiruptor tergarcus DSM 16512 TaxID=1069081 RepID=A0A1W1WQY1_9BACT|nr:FmdE family protein [Nitratiruptor tergarcus]SMC08615.1 Formylmethanofuran dehydrogenase subunit E [Nitratiruptor tergarcus DSM 16512]
MTYPEFFDRVESIMLYDPLADFLGAIESGVIEITYLDVVKFAGHSCPTVAGAYLMAKLGLEKLFPDAMPHRGEIKVLVKGKKDAEVNGVIGNTIAYICGVSDEAGFKGIGGRFNRSNKLFYDAPISGQVRLERVDNGEYVDLAYDPSSVPPNPKMKELMQLLIMGKAGIEEKKMFQSLWQERVEKILLNKENWNRVLTISSNK